MEYHKRVELIKRGLSEIIDEDRLDKIVKERALKVYWGTAPTGMPHIGYFLPIYKISELLKAESEVIILIADIHAYLDNLKSPLDLLEKRKKVYKFLITEMLKLLNAPTDKLKFVYGSDYQLSENYTFDMYKISSLASYRDTKKAGTEVVKQLETPKMSSLLYPILQALDEEYLKVDAQLGGLDQRKIFMFAREFLPRIGYNKRIHLMHSLIPGLTKDGKMSSSEPNSKIGFFDTDEEIKKKIRKAYSVDGEIENNGLLALMKSLIFKSYEEQNKNLVIERPEKFGGNISFANYTELEEAFHKKELKSIDLKDKVADEIIRQFVAPIRNRLEEIKELYAEAYLNK